MLANLKLKDNRVFKLDKDIYNVNFKTEDIDIVANNNMVMDYQLKYEETLKTNEKLKQEIEILKNKLTNIEQILKN